MITNMTMMIKVMMKTTRMMMKRNIRYVPAKFTPPPSSKERKTTSSLFARTWSAPKQKGQIIKVVVSQSWFSSSKPIIRHRRM